MAPLFSKADLNKFWHDVQNEVSLICAKFGKDLFSISKVIGRKTKWPRFFGIPCMCVFVTVTSLLIVIDGNKEATYLLTYLLVFSWVQAKTVFQLGFCVCVQCAF